MVQIPATTINTNFTYFLRLNCNYNGFLSILSNNTTISLALHKKDSTGMCECVCKSAFIEMVMLSFMQHPILFF